MKKCRVCGKEARTMYCSIKCLEKRGHYKGWRKRGKKIIMPCGLELKLGAVALEISDGRFC